MPGFSMAAGSNITPRFQDTGQGASGRLASWMAWTADPSPLIGPETTRIVRMDDNGTLTYDPRPIPIYLQDDFGTYIVDDFGNKILVGEQASRLPVPLGTGGCGTWAPILDGFSNGATSGGDNAFYTDAEPAPNLDQLTDNRGNALLTNLALPLLIGT